MFESPERLAERIRLGEDNRLELKTITFAGDNVRGPARDDLADEVAAFANARGGQVVIGVDDRTREVVGIDVSRLDIVDRYVAELCHDAIKPPLMPAIHRTQLAGADGTARAVICVDVPHSLFVHESPGGYFYRVGSSKRRMTPEYLGRLMQQRSQARLIRFDEQVVPGAELSDLDSALVDRFRTVRTSGDRESLLRKLAMAREDESGALKPTVAGVLLGTKHPQHWLSHAYIQAVAYQGDGSPGVESGVGYQIDAKDLVGPLDAQVIEACRFVARNMRVGATKHVGRHDVPQYDMTAVFEALVNAVAHRDYSMHGSRIRLRIFATRLEIYSPGSLANTMTVESLAFRQASRNEAITSLLAKCTVPGDVELLKTQRATLMDQRGEGVAIVLERSEQLSGKRPIYEMIDDSELKLTIFAAAPGPEPVSGAKNTKGDPT